MEPMERAGQESDGGAGLRMRLFAYASDQPRARRVTDAVLLGAAVLALAFLSLAANPLPGFLRALQTFLRSWPDLFDVVWQVAVDLLPIVAAALVVAAVVRRRWSVARDLVLAAASALVVSALVARVVDGEWPELWTSLPDDGGPWYPFVQLAVPAAAVIAASPHLVRPARRADRWLLGFAALASTVLGATSPVGAVASLLTAAIAASAVHVALGSSAGRPALRDVEAALTELGVPVRRLGAADRQRAGVFTVEAEALDGAPLLVKVYGRDAHDAAVVSTLWRTVWLREPGARLRLGRRQQVEHEALLTLLARQAGVATDSVVIAGATDTDDALLVLRQDGRPLAGGAPLDPADVWALVERLHDAGIVHGEIDDRHLVRVDGALGLADFHSGSLAPSLIQRRIDEVQALVTTAEAVGVPAALEGARRSLGHDRMTAMLPFLQPSVLTAAQRDALRERGLDLDELRAEAATTLGVEPPELHQLRRITVGSVVRVLLPAVAIVALLSSMSGLAWGDLRDQLDEARWWLVALAFAATQLPRLTQAVSTLGASPAPLPLGPVYALQLAVSYINLAVPTMAARVAVNIRFFQRHGVPSGAAMAAGALDGFTSFVVQAVLLLGLLLLTPLSLQLELDSPLDSGMSRVVLLVLALVVVAVGVVLAVPSWRRGVLSWLAQLTREAIGALRGLRSPRRLLLLIGGSVATEVLFALALGLFVRSLGYSVGLGELLVINISVSLLAGLLPVPGGIGVVEGGLTIGLVRAGVPEEVAFAAVLMFRLSSFYLPPIWGWGALRWLERNDHL
jgi:uncharacterized membrane protein YbhN (UPF0104 family)